MSTETKQAEKKAVHYLDENISNLMKIIAPVLLVVAFASVLLGWYDLRSSATLDEPIRSALFVPLMLFGVMAIINVMIFASGGVSTFLAIFFIGTVIAGPEVAEKGALAALSSATGGTDAYADTIGGLGSAYYEPGGIAEGALPSEAREEKNAGAAKDIRAP